MPNLIRAQPKEEEILHNIMQYYIYEFSKYIPSIRLEKTGAYSAFNLKRYWEDDDFHAFFIKKDDEWIGFALVESETETSPNTIHEFFIMAKYSGRGYGKQVAKELFAMFPGNWKITQIENNQPAHAFWSGLVKEISNGNYTEHFKEGKFIQEFKTGKTTC